MRTGAPWRLIPHDLPPWALIYQQPGNVLALLYVTYPFVVRSVQPVLLEMDRTECRRGLLLGLLELGLRLELGLAGDDAGRRRRRDGGAARRPGAEGAVEHLEVEHGAAGGAGDRGTAEVVEAGAAALADPHRAQLPAFGVLTRRR